jgi:hypothetical protein
MPVQRSTILNDPAIHAEFKQTWQDSQPGVAGGHEEGGFVLRDSVGNLSVVRWPKGSQSIIILPPHANCRIGEHDIVATFHTHPNTGSDYLQEPGETDKRAVRDDPDLKGRFYEGEFVISQETVYLISPNGQVNEVGDTRDIFAEG